jgi:hypothetical protein
MAEALATPSAGALASTSRQSILRQSLLIGVFIIVMNYFFELKDRLVYENFYSSLNSCQWLGCFLISDAVRSPIFLSLIIGGHRLGLGFDVTFTLISLLGLVLATRAFRDSNDPMMSTRFALISITFGAWLYLIQIKLFLALALYLLSVGRSRRWLRITLAVAAVLTHESIVFFIGLHFLWRPSDFRLSLRSIAVLGGLVALLAIYLGASSNVFVSALYKIQRYNEYAQTGEVPSMARVGSYSLLMLLFGMIGFFRMRISPSGGIDVFQLKVLLWMFLPWFVFLVFASNELYAIRLSELAVVHTLLVVPLAQNYFYPSRIGLLIFALTFGLLTFVRDVIFFP